MSSDVGIGDSEVPYLIVKPAGPDTAVTAPDTTGTPTPMTPGPLEPVEGSSDLQQRWTATAPVVYSQAGVR